MDARAVPSPVVVLHRITRCGNDAAAQLIEHMLANDEKAPLIGPDIMIPKGAKVEAHFL